MMWEYTGAYEQDRRHKLRYELYDIHSMHGWGIRWYFRLTNMVHSGRRRPRWGET